MLRTCTLLPQHTTMYTRYHYQEGRKRKYILILGIHSCLNRSFYFRPQERCVVRKGKNKEPYRGSMFGARRDQSPFPHVLCPSAPRYVCYEYIYIYQVRDTTLDGNWRTAWYSLIVSKRCLYFRPEWQRNKYYSGAWFAHVIIPSRGCFFRFLRITGMARSHESNE